MGVPGEREPTSLEKFEILDPRTNSPYRPGEYIPIDIRYEQLKKLESYYGRRHFAKVYGLRKFPWFCENCQKDQPFSGEQDACLVCFPKEKKSDRAQARAEGRQEYYDTKNPCSLHPHSTFHVNTGKCLACFTSTGARRVYERQREKPRMLDRATAPGYLEGDWGAGLAEILEAVGMDAQQGADHIGVPVTDMLLWLSDVGSAPPYVAMAFDSLIMRRWLHSKS